MTLAREILFVFAGLAALIPSPGIAFAADGALAIAVRRWEGEYATNGISTPYTETIALLNADGTGLRTVVAEADARCAAPSFSPDGRWLYYQSNVGGQYHLYRCRADGTAKEALTSASKPGLPWTSVFGVQVAADGSVLGTAYDGAKGCVVVLSPDGRSIRPVAPHLGYLYMAALSPRGDAVVASGPASGYRLWLLPLSEAFETGENRLTKPAVNLTPDHPDSYAPQFTPDGKTIVFLRRDGDVYCVQVDGTGLRRLTTGNDYVEMRLSQKDQHGSTDGPHLSPDGKRIACIARRDGVPNVCVLDIDGANFRQVTFLKTACGRPRWSPDGKTLAFVSFVGTRPQLFTVPAEGGEPRQITRLDDGVVWIAWKPRID